MITPSIIDLDVGRYRNPAHLTVAPRPARRVILEGAAKQRCRRHSVWAGPPSGPAIIERRPRRSSAIIWRRLRTGICRALSTDSARLRDTAPASAAPAGGRRARWPLQ